MIGIENSLNITIENVSETCPRCGGRAYAGDGTYSHAGGKLKVDKGPPRTHALVAELKRIAEVARARKLTTEEVLAEIADVSPGLAKKLKGIGPWPVAGLLLFLFWLIKSVSLNMNFDVNHLIDQAWHLGHGDDPEQHLDTPPPDLKDFDIPSPTHPPELDTVIASAPNRQARRKAAARAKRKRGLDVR